MRIIGGKFKGTKLSDVLFDGTRPTSDRVRETIFNILQHNSIYGVLKNASVLDVCAGTGAMGLEALSRGASFCVFIDHHVKAVQNIRQNCLKLHSEVDVQILQQSCGSLSESSRPYDYIFMDPPYDLDIVNDLLNELNHKGYVKHETVLIVETKKTSNKMEAFHDLSEVFVIKDQRIIGPAMVTFIAASLHG